MRIGRHIRSQLMILLLLIGAASLPAAEGFQEVAQQEQQAFAKSLKQALKKQLPKASKKVQYLYRSIGYEPIWVDKDYLSYHAEMLISEIKNDHAKGLHPEIFKKYRKLIPNENQLFTSDSIEEKARVEIGMMQLYADSINSILKDRKSKYTALSLLKKAVKERSIMAAIDTLADERIVNATFSRDLNLTEAEAKQAKYRDLAKRLIGKDAKVRLKAMYELLDYRPIWITEKGRTDYTKTLFSKIASDATLDRNSSIYRQYLSLKEGQVPAQKEQIAQEEFDYAKLYQDYMSHLLYGDIDWKKFQHLLRSTRKHGVWVVHPILETPESLLIQSLSHHSLDYAFEEAKPKFHMYDRMVEALKHYKQIAAAGGWKMLPEFKNLKPGARSTIVPALRERLKIEGDYVCDHNETGNRYSGCLVDAVKKFQFRHGLTTEGYIGKLTRKALSETAEQKVAKLKLNIDRIKWIKRDDDRYHIYVNIPSFRMYMYDGKTIVEEMRVIVGRKGHETPIFYGRVRTIVLNPYWRIPPSIIRHETVPKLIRDPGYADKKHIEIHTGYSEHSPRVNPRSVNWHKYAKRLPPYKFMQSPGEQNALGKVKYLFPNKYSVYMHDTNERHLFVKDYRALSHGCVRLGKPFNLLEVFSDIESNIDYDKAQTILKENKKTPFRLRNTVPVDIVYLTSLVDIDGNVMFWDDVYGYDKMQFQCLKK